MHEETLPIDVRELLDSCIDSVEALDTLVLLHADPDRWWPLSEVARVLAIDPDSARTALAGLSGKGLAAEGGDAMFRLASLAPLEHAAFAALALACRKERAAVVEHLSRRPMARLRFLAEAFTRGGNA